MPRAEGVISHASDLNSPTQPILRRCAERAIPKATAQDAVPTHARPNSKPHLKRDVLLSCHWTRSRISLAFNRRVIGCVAVDRRLICPPRSMVPPWQYELIVIMNGLDQAQRFLQEPIGSVNSKSSLHYM